MSGEKTLPKYCVVKMTIQYVFCSLVLGLVFLCQNSLQSRQFFRQDYTYLEETKNFYKIHTLPKTWKDAKSQCAHEGAKLFFPDNEYEAETVLKFWSDTQPFASVFIGVSDLIVKGVFETVDGLSIDEVYNKWSPGNPDNAGGDEGCVVFSRKDGLLDDENCNKQYPFICKKAQNDLTWNDACDLPDLGYEYSKELDHCYKFHDPANWTDAYAACRAEQSYLAVINSEIEANFVARLAKKSKKAPFLFNYVPKLIMLGFHNRDLGGWKTIKGTSLQDSGYANWAIFRPNGGLFELCGSMYYDSGHLNDIGCSARCSFVCEHEINGGNDDLDERFGD